MKLSTLIVCLGIFGAAVANAATYTVTLYEKATVSGTELKPGEYKVDWSGDTAKILSGKKMIVEAKVKAENDSAKFDKTTVRYSSANGGYKLEEIRLGGTKTKLIFNE